MDNPYLGTAGKVSLLSAESAVLEPPLLMSASEYAAQHIYLSAGARGGRVDLSLTPYYVEWLDMISNPDIRRIVLMTSTQVGKTTALLLGMTWAAACNPAPILWVSPRGQDVEHMLRNRLRPMIEASPDLDRRLSRRRHDQRKNEVKFGNGTVIYTGTGRSAASLREKPVWMVCLDEVDGYPKVVRAGEGANAIQLAERRTMSWGSRAKMVIASTPTTPDAAISVEFEAGDRRRYWIPCPSCGHFQTLEWSQLKWTRGTPRHRLAEEGDIHYECANAACRHRITNREKLESNRLAKWVQAEASIEPATGEVSGAYKTDRISYHLDALYSPFVTWEIAADAQWYCEDNPEENEQTHKNLWEGKAFQQVRERLQITNLEDRVGDYCRGEVPAADLLCVTAGVDVQYDGFWYVLRAWGYDEQSWLLDHGWCTDWQTLKRVVCKRSWPLPPEKKGDPDRLLRVMRVMIDSAGHREAEVYQFAREMGHIVRATKGRDKLNRPWVEKVLDKSKVQGGVGTKLVEWSHAYFFPKMTAAMRQDHGRHGCALYYRDVDRNYLDQLLGNQLVQKRNTAGRLVQEWQQVGPDHLFDAECLAFVGADHFGVHAYQRGGITEEIDDRAPPPRPLSPDKVLPNRRRSMGGYRRNNRRWR